MVGLNSFLTIIMLILLHFLIVIHKKISIEHHRNNLFSVRHKLFLLPNSHEELKYDTKIYRYYERMVNNQIRFAEKVNFMEIFIFKNLLRKNQISLKVENHAVKKEVNNLQDEFLISELKEIEDMITKETLLLFTKTSLVFDIYMIWTIIKTFNIKSENFNTKIVNQRTFRTIKVVSGLENSYHCTT